MSMFVEPHFPNHPRCYGSKCSKCGREASGERVLNTGIEIDHHDGLYGILYLCESCVLQMGREFGMLSLDQVAKLQGHLDLVMGEQAVLVQQLIHYEHLQRLIEDGEFARRERLERDLAEAAVEVGPAGEIMVPVKPLGRRRS